MEELITRFCVIALKYPEYNLEKLYNRFLEQLPEEERQFVIENFMLILKAADAARTAIPAVKEKILQCQ